MAIKFPETVKTNKTQEHPNGKKSDVKTAGNKPTSPGHTAKPVKRAARGR
jgi:hypothetical protein